jgi:PKD repeat protein
MDDGNTWSNEVQVNRLSENTTNQWYPDIACDTEGVIYVVWADNTNGHWDILLSKSKNNGNTWSNPTLVNDATNPERGYNQLKPSIAVDGMDNILISWEDDRMNDKQIFFAKSTNGGKSYSKDMQVSKWSPDVNAKNPKITADLKGNSFLVWEEDYFSKYNVFFSHSIDQGSSFSVPVQVNNESDKCSPDAAPVVVVDTRGNIFVSWSDQRAENHIYLSFSVDNGKSFNVNEVVDDADDTPATPISQTTEEELERSQQVLTLLDGKVYVSWTDYRNDPNPDNQISENSDLYIDWDTTPGNRDPKRIDFNEEATIKGWNYINLTWSASEDIDYNEYLIYKSTVKNFEPELLYLHDAIGSRYHNYINITNLSSSTNYYFRLVVEDLGGLTNNSKQYAVSTRTNIPPVIEIIEPDGKLDVVNSEFEISWLDSDPDDNASIKLYYDNNRDPNDNKKLIIDFPHGEDSRQDFYAWDTSNIPNGSYYILAIISDPINGDHYPVYSPGKVTIHHGNLDPVIILFINPNNSTDVDLNEPVTVRFNKPIDMTSVHQDSFYVQDSKNSKVLGEYQFNLSSNKLKFYPTTRWNGSEKYQVFISTSIKDQSGLFSLNSDYSWWFETREFIIPNGNIFGQVLDKHSLDPIGGASVILTDEENTSNTQSSTTDDSGRFTFLVNYGEYGITVSAKFYQTPPSRTISINKASIDITFELNRPVIVSYNMKSKIKADEAFEVSADAIHPDNDVIEYIWDFGDGTISAGQNVSHKYKDPGTFEVRLTVRDEDGGEVNQTMTIIVEEAGVGINYILLVSSFAIAILIIGLIVIAVTARRAKEKRLKELGEELDSRTKLDEEEDEVEEEDEEEIEIEEKGEEPEEDLVEQPEEDELEEQEPLEEELEEEEPLGEDEEIEAELDADVDDEEIVVEEHEPVTDKDLEKGQKEEESESPEDKKPVKKSKGISKTIKKSKRSNKVVKENATKEKEPIKKVKSKQKAKHKVKGKMKVKKSKMK